MSTTAAPAKTDLTLNAYLILAGRCKEALDYYAEVFRGSYRVAHYLRDLPGAGEYPKEFLDNIVHAEFEGPGFRFFASDGMQCAPLTSENAPVQIAINLNSVEEGQRLYDALRAEGSVICEYGPLFWGATYGAVKDRFGVSWLINAAQDPQ